jgi:lysophospholipase L1-like esterase
MSATRRRLTRTRKAAFAVLACVLLWPVAEILVAAVGLDKRPSERVYTDVYDAAYELLPGVHVPFGNAPLPEDPTNHAGFRGPEFTNKKPAGVYRIISVGDSTTFGVMVPEPQTYSRRLATALGETGRNVEVLNTGVPGTNIYAHRVLLAKHLLGFEPDLLILYVLYNSRPEVEAVRRATEAGSANTPLQTMLRYSPIYRLLRRVLKGGFFANLEGPVEFARQAPKTDIGNPGGWVETSFQTDLRRFINQAKDENVNVLLVYHLNAIDLGRTLTRRDDPALPKNTSEQFNDRLRDFTGRTAAEQKVWYLDARPAFLEKMAGGENLFLDEVHFSAAGHAVMAAELAAFLQDHLPLR